MPNIGFWATAGAGGGVSNTALELISTYYGSGSESTISFSSIPSTFKHLQLRIVARTSLVGNYYNFDMQLNGDTSTNYAFHQLYGNGSSVGAYGVSSVNRMRAGIFDGSTSTTNSFGVAIIDIPDYANTSKKKSIRSFNGNTGQPTMNLFSGSWQSTAAISTITIMYNGGNLNPISGSRFSLYGVQG